MLTTNKALERIIREANTVDLIEVLAERLPPTGLQTLLLAVYRQRAEELQLREVLQQYRQNRFVRPLPSHNYQFHDIQVTLTELDDEKRLNVWQDSEASYE